MRSVVGVTPSSAISAPSRAFTNADLPELNSPTITSRNISSRSASARRTSSASFFGAPKSLRKEIRHPRSSRSLSTSAPAARRVSAPLRLPPHANIIDACQFRDALLVVTNPKTTRYGWRLHELQGARQHGVGNLGDRLRSLGYSR